MSARAACRGPHACHRGIRSSVRRQILPSAGPRRGLRRSRRHRSPVPPKKIRLAALETPKGSSLSLDPDSRTAIYDITARTVYMPDGRRLEAHSGLGSAWTILAMST